MRYLENVLIEMLLQPLVRVVDAKLLKTVHLEVLEPKSSQASKNKMIE